jgi:Homing endonuclease associated repeat
MSEVIEQATSAPDLLLVAYRALSASEQERAFDLINAARVKRLAGENSEFGRLLASLKTVADLLGEAPGIDDYKRIRRQLEAEGEVLEPSSRILKHFNGSWHLAKEALGLAEVTTTRRIEARFEARKKRGKVWRYTDARLKEVIAECVAAVGRVPQVAEFDHWRHRELELAKARGQELHLPSASPYRRRWSNWEGALRFFGYSEAEIAGRLERE